MLDSHAKRRIDACRDILVGKVSWHLSISTRTNLPCELIRRMDAKVKATIDRVWGVA